MHLRGALASSLLVLCLAAGASCDTFGGTDTGRAFKRLQRSPNHNGNRFINPIPTPMTQGGRLFRRMIRFVTEKGQRVPPAQPPVQRRRRADYDEAPRGGLRVTWFGHSTMLLEIDGMRVLTDPIFSQRCSPTQAVGPKRFAPTPMRIDELPHLDAIVISHDHYDHLDTASIKALAKRRGLRFFVPLGVAAHLRKWGVAGERIVQLDWWQRTQVGNLTLACTPARHFSGRGLNDRNKTLWASWAIVGPKHRVYFGGDTGMFPGFSEIGRKYGPFDITLMPIGAYDVAWQPIHLNPEEAVRAHHMLRGKLMVPIHWGTFNLALHDWDEPARRLVLAAKQQGAEIATPVVGQMVTPPPPAPPTQPWWEQVKKSAPALQAEAARTAATQ